MSLAGSVAVVTGESREIGKRSALTRDGRVLEKSGRVLVVAELAAEYGFRDEP